MRGWVAQLLNIQHPDPEVQRRGRNVVIVALALLAIETLLLVLSRTALGVVGGVWTLPILVGMIVLTIGLILAAQRGYVAPAALVLVLLPLLAVLIGTLDQRPLNYRPFFFVISLLLAGVTLRPAGIGFTFLVALLGLIFMGYQLWDVPQPSLPALNSLILAGMLCLLAAIMGSIGSASTGHAVRAAHQARTQAEHAAAELERSNSLLEQRVAERTSALENSLAQQQAQAGELRQALEEQQRLLGVVADLALPVLPVREDTVVMPLVGMLDAERAEQLRRRALEAIEQRHARRLILDVTGLPMLDTFVARALIDTATAARLLGAQAMLVGIRPEVAQTLVSLGINLSSLETHATLQEVLERRERRASSTRL